MVEDMDDDDKVRLAFELLDRGIAERRARIEEIVLEIDDFQEQRRRLVEAIRKGAIPH